MQACPYCGSDVVVSTLPLMVAGKFRLEKRIGAGGKGVVYQAEDLDLHRKVAVKALRAQGPGIVAMLREEARFMALLDHPGLATIHGMEISDDIPVLILELFERGTLRDRLQSQRIPAKEVIQIGIRLADALDYLHARQMLHGDVKPSNVGVTDAGSCKLIDFGLARVTGADQDLTAMADGGTIHGFITTAGPGRAGTPAYLPPEAFGRNSFELRDDVWALAMSIYELTAGTHPYLGKNGQLALARVLDGDIPDIREYEPACPPAFADLLRTALDADRSRRPGSATELAAGLRRLIA